jgi:hypothetical protein
MTTTNVAGLTQNKAEKMAFSYLAIQQQRDALYAALQAPHRPGAIKRPGCRTLAGCLRTLAKDIENEKDCIAWVDCLNRYADAIEDALSRVEQGGADPK